MAKSKKTKKVKSDEVHAKKSAGVGETNPFARFPGATSQASRKMNPFEIHVNKEKFQILGRTCKHDKGLPGVSRAKAVRKRQQTLGQEYRTKHKTNKFKDLRIGKNCGDAELNENVLNARYVAEKMSQFKQNKLSRFNLNDDEVLLTHRGQTLEEIEQFRDDRSDDDEDENNDLNANFTEAAHFGGDDAQQNDRQTAIDEMILETKRRKAEVAKEKDEVFDLTEKLDKNYKEILGLVSKMSKTEMKAKQPPDDYDKIMREMIFEPRGAVADKLLSEEELAKKEKERLETLERERLARMRAEQDGGDEQKPKHRSADDLDDGYFIDGKEVDDEVGILAYNMDGKLSGTNGTSFKSQENEINGDDNNSEEEQSNSEQDGDEESDDEGNDSVDDEEAEGEEDKSDSDSEDEEQDDNLSDLKDSDTEDESKGVVGTQPLTPNPIKQKKLKTKVAKTGESVDLPFTIDMPSSYQEFIKLIKPHTPENQAELVERIIKCNHPKLDVVNREKIVQFFSFLIKYIDELFVDASSEDVTLSFSILAGLNPLLYDLMHLNPEKMSLILLNYTQQKYAEFNKNPKSYPTLEVFVLLKLISNFFSTSDFRHPVVTPCLIFAQHILSKARVRSRQDIAQGLFLVTVLLEYTHQSRRFLPAVFNYLLGIVYLAIPKRSVAVLKIVPPFQSTGPMNKLLAIAELPEQEALAEQLMSSEDLVTITLTVDFKIRALNTALKLINDAVEVASENIGAQYVAAPLLEMLERLPLEVYPDYVCKNYAKTKETLEDVSAKPLIKLVPPERKPKALRLLEPRFEAVYDDKRRPKMTKEKEERAKLLHKLKRETKGAVREIRRDTEFIQKMRIKQQMQSDLERKEKVKRIYQEASAQQGELNELARAKKKKKF